jgi:uncharacterized iron-regulated membrane protein
MRRILFWMHLSAGVLAGALILFFAATGALLAYERQIVHAADKRFYKSEAKNASRLPLDDALAAAVPALPAPPEMVIVYRDQNWPVEIQTGNRTTYFVDPHSGQVQGPASPGTRALFAEVTALHRWFGLANANHATATAVKGVVVLLFLFLLLSGAYIWIPKVWARHIVRGGIVPRFDVEGRARNYNWHKVTGFWFVLPLAVIVSTGIVMAYPWANALLFRIAGSPMPVRGERPDQRRHAGAGRHALPVRLDQAFALAAGEMKDWRSITLRLQPGGPGLNLTVDRGDGGQPQLREQLTINPKTMEIVRREPFAAMSRGQRWRMWVRFAHTGEAGGWLGQTLAFLTACAAVLLSITGYLLSLSRLQRWRRAKRAAIPDREPAAAITR